MLVEHIEELKPSTKRELQRAGYLYVHQLVNKNAIEAAPITPLELTTRCKGMQLEEAALVLELLQQQHADQLGGGRNNNTGGGPIVVSAADLWRRELEQPSPRIPTFSATLDDLLGGGIQVGTVTEIVGSPGVGKTQLCLQLATNVQIPQAFGSLGGRCYYIDTEGSFIPGRFREVTQAAVAHVHKVAHQQREDISARELTQCRNEVDQYTVSSVFNSTYYHRVYDLAELVALINVLDDLLEQDPSIKLIVIDSIAFHFRYAFDDFVMRSRLLFQTATKLAELATKYEVAVVTTNQVTSQRAKNPTAAGGNSINSSNKNNNVGQQDGQSGMHHVATGAGAPPQEQGESLVPALGDAWAHGIGTRLRLYNPQTCPTLLLPPTTTSSGGVNTVVGGAEEEGSHRVACLEKAGDLPRGTAAFKILSKGLR